MTETHLLQPDWSDIHRALVIIAHPDDPDFICAGTCLQMARQGIEVTYMVLTNGDKGNHNPEITRNQLIAMRKIEQRSSGKDVRRPGGALHGRGGWLSAPQARMRKRVTREIRRMRPELIICTIRTVTLLATPTSTTRTTATPGWSRWKRSSPRPTTRCSTPTWPTKATCPTRSASSTSRPQPTQHRVHITADIQPKIEAILAHKTQFSEPEQTKKRWLELVG